ncbi:MAG: hypothetical protein AAF690_10005 [Acidobacteriota bacterium]
MVYANVQAIESERGQNIFRLDRVDDLEDRQLLDGVRAPLSTSAIG